MTPAAAAEYRSNIGHDFTLADAYDAEYLDADAEVEADAEAERRERWRINAAMAEWWGN